MPAHDLAHNAHLTQLAAFDANAVKGATEVDSGNDVKIHHTDPFSSIIVRYRLTIIDDDTGLKTPEFSSVYSANTSFASLWTMDNVAGILGVRCARHVPDVPRPGHGHSGCGSAWPLS